MIDQYTCEDLELDIRWLEGFGIDRETSLKFIKFLLTRPPTKRVVEKLEIEVKP